MPPGRDVMPSPPADPLNLTSGFMPFSLLRPTRRPSSDDSSPEVRSRGLPRAIGWSLSLAFAALLLATPASVNAADPDEGTSLLGGLTGGLGGIVDPVTETVDPITAILEPITDPVVEPLVEPVVEPLVEPAAALVEPVVEPVVEPLVEPVTTAVEPVITVLDPVTALVEPIVEPVVEPIVDPVTGPLVEPVEGITSEPSGDGGMGVVPSVAEPSTPTTIPYPPIVDVPAIMSGPNALPESASSASLPAPTTAPGLRLLPTAGGNASVFEDLGAWTTAPQAFDAGASGSSSTASTLSAPWWSRISPMGAFGGPGSGQVLSGVSMAVAIGLGLLLLFLMPPPFRVSRLQLAAVFWRPQAFVGPLERPG